MKTNLFFGLLMVVGLNHAQNVDENKVSLTYIQLPLNVINKALTVYEVDVTKSYEQANEDSLANYQVELESAAAIYESQLAQWQAQCDALKRDYLTKMAAWEKQTNASDGAITNPPAEPQYPAHPIQQVVELPFLHNDLDDNTVQNTIELQGFSRGPGGAIITVDIQPIAEFKIVENIKETNGVRKFEYTCNYKLPLGLKVEAPGQGIVLQTIIGNSIQNYNLQTYDSQYEFDLWWMDNEDQFWMDFERKVRQKALQNLNTELNNKCGFPTKSRTIEVYTIKRFKDHDYADLTTAYTLATQGYQKVSNTRDRSEAHDKLTAAINMWKKALEESNLSDNKARVNDKVTALLQCNIAQAYIWMSEFDQAEVYLNLAKNSGISKFKRIAERLTSLLQERKQRWNAYFG